MHREYIRFECTLLHYSLYLHAWATQFQFTQDDLNGTRFRQLTMGFTGPGLEYQFSAIHVTPDSHWAFLAPGWVDGVRNEVMMVKIPPAPVDDGIDRTTFLQYRVDVPETGVSTKARVRFGYAENGPISSLCTSRRRRALPIVSPSRLPTSSQISLSQRRALVAVPSMSPSCPSGCCFSGWSAWTAREG